MFLSCHVTFLNRLLATFTSLCVCLLDTLHSPSINHSMSHYNSSFSLYQFTVCHITLFRISNLSYTTIYLCRSILLIAPLQGGVELLCVVFPIIAISLTPQVLASFSDTSPKSPVNYVNLHTAYFAAMLLTLSTPFNFFSHVSMVKTCRTFKVCHSTWFPAWQ